MEPARPWEELSKEELQKLYEEQKELYEEIEEEMHFVLKYSNCHLPGNTRAKYEQQLKVIQQRMDHIKELLNNK
ncbi:MAG: hypothetical protein H0Z35_02985 [Thermoanaerobacteraceae bacterium]|nr:hypothetical protein [Thermoanaerobacteraceae bacterium]